MILAEIICKSLIFVNNSTLRTCYLKYNALVLNAFAIFENNRENNSIEDLLTLHTFFLPFQENVINCKRQEGKR